MLMRSNINDIISFLKYFLAKSMAMSPKAPDAAELIYSVSRTHRSKIQPKILNSPRNSQMIPAGFD